MDHWIDEKRWNRMEMDEIKWNENGYNRIMFYCLDLTNNNKIE
jgi:hypothetical protein